MKRPNRIFLKELSLPAGPPFLFFHGRRDFRLMPVVVPWSEVLRSRPRVMPCPPPPTSTPPRGDKNCPPPHAPHAGKNGHPVCPHAHRVGKKVSTQCAPMRWQKTPATVAQMPPTVGTKMSTTGAPTPAACARLPAGGPTHPLGVPTKRRTTLPPEAAPWSQPSTRKADLGVQQMFSPFTSRGYFPPGLGGRRRGRRGGARGWAVHRQGQWWW